MISVYYWSMYRTISINGVVSSCQMSINDGSSVTSTWKRTIQKNISYWKSSYVYNHSSYLLNRSETFNFNKSSFETFLCRSSSLYFLDCKEVIFVRFYLIILLLIFILNWTILLVIIFQRNVKFNEYFRHFRFTRDTCRYQINSVWFVIWSCIDLGLKIVLFGVVYGRSSTKDDAGGNISINNSRYQSMILNFLLSKLQEIMAQHDT